MSLVLLDEDLKEIQRNDWGEFFIWRDPTFELPPLIEQNVTSSLKGEKQFFAQHFFDLRHLNVNLTYSIHLEMAREHSQLSYLVVYRFNSTSPIQDLTSIDGWRTFCSTSNASIFRLMIESFPRSVFHSILLAVRQLNREETNDLCQNSNNTPPTSFDTARSFTSNYFLRVFLSGCFYLDEHQRWRSDRLKVKTSQS